MDRIDITQLKQQLPAIGHAVVTGKQDYEQLQARVRIVEGQVQDLVILSIFSLLNHHAFFSCHGTSHYETKYVHEMLEIVSINDLPKC